MSRLEGNLISFSSDSGGLFSELKSAGDIPTSAGWLNIGIEAVASPSSVNELRKLVERGGNPKDRVDGVHGRLGTVLDPRDYEKGLIDWLFVQLADTLIAPTEGESMFDRFNPFTQGSLEMIALINKLSELQGNSIYLNVHNDEVANKFVMYNRIVVPTLGQGKLLIENGPNKGGYQEVERLVNMLRASHDSDGKNVKIGGNLDFVHLVVEMEHGGMPDFAAVERHWPRILKLFDSSIFGNVHIPIGLKKSDSLPILEMVRNNKVMLRDLVQMLVALGTHITFENQHSMLLGVWNRSKEVDRLREIRDGFMEAGLKN